MTSALIQFLLQRVRATGPARTASGVAQQLMQRAGARAGTDPRQARELRHAALAYLSVIR